MKFGAQIGELGPTLVVLCLVMVLRSFACVINRVLSALLIGRVWC